MPVRNRAPIVRQTFRLDELLDMILSVTGKMRPHSANSSFGDGCLSFLPLLVADLTRTMRSCPLPWRDFQTPILCAHSTLANAHWPFLNLRARTPSTYWNWMRRRSETPDVSETSFWKRLLGNRRRRKAGLSDLFYAHRATSTGSI